MAKKTLSTEQIEGEAIGIIKMEKSSWSDAAAFITERVSFRMRNLIRQIRKNYWGVFNKPVDSNTGRKKVWLPLSSWLTDTATKATELDTKDINYRAKRPSSIGLNSVIKTFSKNNFDEINFGEKLNHLTRDTARDGTGVWKVVESKKNGKAIANLLPIDLLNIYIDPTAESIQDAYRFTERHLMTKDEVEGMTGWINIENIETQTNLGYIDPEISYKATGTSEFVDVWEMWGKIPKSLISGKEKDRKEVIDGHIIISGLETGNNKVHLLEANDGGLKPYEEAWYKKVSGRWYGVGIVEEVMMLQLWLNLIVNMRITRSTVSQLGIFKIKKGSGVTPASLQRLAASGALVVNNTDDVEQFVMQEASMASYKDEENILTWARNITSAVESVTGEQMPASTTATAVAVQSHASKSTFAFVKEGYGLFLQRLIKRHMMPIFQKNLKQDMVLRYTGEIGDIKTLDERVVNYNLYKQLTDIRKSGGLFDEVQVLQEQAKAMAKLTAIGSDRYFKILSKIKLDDFDVQVYVTNEEIDKNSLVQNLMALLQMSPSIPQAIDPTATAEQIIDTLGLSPSQFKPKEGQQPQVPQGQAPIPNANISSPTEQESFTGANTPI